jgi:predicted lipid-binding transport protein (Tim44 family)
VRLRARGWRGPLSLGIGVQLLLGSTPAAAAGSSVAFGGLTTWIGVLAALWTLLTPRRAGDFAGAATVVALGILLLAAAGWQWHRQRTRRPGRALRTVPVGAGSLVAVPSGATIPLAAAFDGAQVLEAARSRFLRLQAAWDAGDVHALGQLTTPDMLQELLPVLTTRGDAPSRTDVITLHAELLAIEEFGAAWLASVEFSGLIRESAEQGAVPFREVWMLAASKEGAPAWRLARQQALL